MKKYILPLLSVALIATVFSCSKGDDNDTKDNNFDRKALLTYYADKQIIPAYNEMSDAMNKLKTAVDAFVVDVNNQNYKQLSTTFNNAYTSWQKTELLEFGPAADVSLRMYMNIYPVTTTKVNANITSGNYDLETFNNKDAQGFPALDYLLNGVGVDETAIINYYNDAALGNNRKQYLVDLATKMKEKIDGVNTAWINYRSSFIENAGTDANSSFSMMVNAYVLYYERYLRTGKIGLPVGAMTGTAKPELVESYYSPSHSRIYALEALGAVKNFYYGNNINSLYSYLKAADTKDENGKLIADLILEKFDVSNNLLNELGILKDEVTTNRTKVLDVYQSLQNNVPLLKVDMVSALGISITYTDNDGD